MLKGFKTSIGRNITNARGWRTNRKIVVIESDDWGSIRMPNKITFKKFTNLGYDLSNNPYCRFDTLANTEDLSALFDLLKAYKDKNGHHPKLTFNTVMANPLFKEIKESEYSEYFYEPFTQTLKRYYPNENILELWKQGMDEKLIQPQFHGREHVNVPLWLNMLEMGNDALKAAFELEFWGIPRYFYGRDKSNIQAAYNSADENDLEFYKKNIFDGTSLFKQIFGFNSKTFIANNYTFSEGLSKTLRLAGIKGIQSMKYHKMPQKDGSLGLKDLYTGKKNTSNQIYTIRNCVFEPSQMPARFENVRNCLKEISNSFYWGKPAIITSHRLNYIGVLDEQNRNRNLRMLGELFQQILKKWPDVEFMSSDELVDLIN